MPLWSIENWRARIGSAWCALGIHARKLASSKTMKPRTSTQQLRILVTLSLTIQVIGYLLCLLEQTTVIQSCIVRSGDVELNPGPGRYPDLDYDSVNNQTLLGEDDLPDVMHAVIEIRSSYYTLGSVLGIRYGDMAAIKHDNPQDAKQALYWVLVKWLSQDEKHGSPTWRKLVEAVDNEAGGNNHALAKRIAKQHPTGLQVGAVLNLSTDSGLQVGAVLNLSTDSVASPSGALCRRCRETIASYYLRQVTDDHAWPPVKQTFFNLALLKDGFPTWRRTPQRSVEDIVSSRNHITYENLLKDLKDLEKKLILIEGRPGSGKTVLMNKIICDWANSKVLQSYIVIFVPFQKLNTKRDRKLETIIKVACPALRDDDLKDLVRYIKECQGKGVVFAFDGLDEYKPYYYKHKVSTLGSEQKKSSIKVEMEDVFEMIYGKDLVKATHLLTSRPSACIEFRKYAGKQIEVLGFLKEQIFRYIEYYFSSDEIKSQKLIDHLQGHPNLMHMCYLPLHCAMLVFFYEEDEVIPTTETEIYKHFILSTIYRSLNKCDAKLVQLKSFHQLSRNDKKLFEQICHLAFEATVESKPVFTSSDVRSISGIGRLGLVVRDQCYTRHGRDETYSFQHLTTQEYLAAVHIARLTEKKQIKLINEHGCKKNLQMTWRFLCGMMDTLKTDLDGTFKALVNVNDDILKCVYYAYEAHKRQPCLHVIQSLKHRIQFKDKQLSHSDCHVLGNVIHQANNEHDIVELEFEGCSITIQGAVLLLQQLGDCPFSLELRSGEALSSFLKALGRFGTSDGGSEIQFLESKNTNLKKLSLGGNNLGPKGLTYCLVEGLKFCSSIKYLDLDDNEIGDDGAIALAEGIDHCTCITDLHLKGNNIGSKGMKALVKSLKSCDHFQSILLWENNLTDDAVPHLIELITSIRCLERLDVSWGNNFSTTGNKQLKEAARTRNSSDDLAKLSIDACIRF